jgi:hypothetical protein
MFSQRLMDFQTMGIWFSKRALNRNQTGFGTMVLDFSGLRTVRNKFILS